jgi:hypothetical protein
MSADAIPFPPAPAGRIPEASTFSPADKLLIDMAELAHLTSLGLRTLRRLDSSRDIPGRVVAGRRVLFQTEVIREWVRAGLPCREEWAALQRSNCKR